MNCPCNSSSKYHACCGKFHLGNLFPPTAEALSRARYSALILNKPLYIYNTWDKSTRPLLKDIEIPKVQNCTHQGFEVINKDMGLEHHDIGMVTFTTTSKDDERPQTELGMYRRYKEKWMFFRSENQ